MSKNIFDTGALVAKHKLNYFPLDKEVLLSADIGKLYPVHSKILIPNDFVNFSIADAVKSFPTLTPFFGQVNVNFYAFVVPLRLLWSHFPKWVYKPEDNDHLPPHIALKKLLYRSQTGNLLDHLGVPPETVSLAHYNSEPTSEKPGLSMSHQVDIYKILAYHSIWNEYFRNETLQTDLTDENQILYDDTTEDYNSIFDDHDPEWYSLRYVNWRRDYFTSCLPNAQSGAAPTLQLFSAGQSAPVHIQLSHLLDYLSSSDLNFPYTNDVPLESVQFPDTPEQDANPLTTDKPHMWRTLLAMGFNPAAETISDKFTAQIISKSIRDYTVKRTANPQYPDYDPETDASNLNYVHHLEDAGHGDPDTYTSVGAKLFADLSNVGSEVTAHSLRSLFAIEKWLEIRNVTGSRYIEGTLAYYGVRVKDSRAQRPEFLGMQSSPVSVNEVVQQSQTTESSNQGHRTGLINNFNATRSFKYFNTEHSVLMVCMALRPTAFYFQGLSNEWFLLDQFDFPYRLFQHLGEQEVKDRELFIPRNPLDTDFSSVFGYQSRYAEWRSEFSEVHGDLRKSLKYWHIGREFDDSDRPALSEQFVQVSNNSGNFNRVFPVNEDYKESEVDHFVIDIYFKFKALRDLAYHSMPSLIS